jgi:hypothetical protein
MQDLVDRMPPSPRHSLSQTGESKAREAKPTRQSPTIRRVSELVCVGASRELVVWTVHLSWRGIPFTSRWPSDLYVAECR